MVGIFRWLWVKAEERTTEHILFEINSMARYHEQQAELAYYKDRYEKTTDDTDNFVRNMLPPQLTSKEHAQVATALRELSERIAPKLTAPTEQKEEAK